MRVLCLLCMMGVLAAQAQAQGPPAPEPDVVQEDRVTQSHKLDSINLLIFVALVILVVVTVWMFKHRRLRFIHETGLAIIYGLIIGAIITFTSPVEEITIGKVNLADDTNVSNTPPDAVQLYMPASNNSPAHIYQYSKPEQLSQANLQEKALEEKATFDPEVFFNVLLPPIIFNAGYNMKRKHFFKNFGAIITFAFLGTTISCMAVGVITYGFTLLRPSFHMAATDCLLFGALISATDPVTVLALFGDLNVDVDLYALVFGESVLNDAVAIVLSGAIEKYDSSDGGFDGIAMGKAIGNFAGVFFGAFALGSAMGCITALLTKYTHIREHPLLETSLFFLMSYGTFLAAEAAGMTGIVAVLFCGICQAHYTYNNLSRESQLRTKEFFELLNFLMENFVFTYIGVSTFTYRQHTKWDPVFIPAAFLGIIVGRALNVYPLAFLLNLGRSNKIRYNFQHMMMFSGLRGAIAFALAIRNIESDQRKVIFSTTLLIVISTVILCGGFTSQMLQWLKIRVGVEEETELQNFQPVRTSQRYQAIDDSSRGQQSHDPRLHGSNLSPTDQLAPPVDPTPGRLAEKARLVRVWYNIDTRYVKPFLTHARPPLTETLPKCCSCLARCLTTEEQLTNFSSGVPRGGDSDTDLILDDHDQNFADASSDGLPSLPGLPQEGATSKANGSSAQVLQLDLHDIHTPRQGHPPLPYRVQGHSSSQGQDFEDMDNVSLDIDTSDTSPLLEYRGAPQGGSTRRSISAESEILQA